MPAEGGTCRSCALVLAGGDPVDAVAAVRICPRVAFVIAADSGLHQAETLGLHGRSHRRRSRLGRSPTPSRPRSHEAQSIERHPAAKDATDLELAIDAAVREGAQRDRRRRRGRRSRRPLPRQRAAPHVARSGPTCASRRASAVRVCSSCTASGRRASSRDRPASLVTLLPVGGAAPRHRDGGPRVPARARRPGPGHDARREQRDDGDGVRRSRSSTERCWSCNRMPEEECCRDRRHRSRAATARDRRRQVRARRGCRSRSRRRRACTTR